MAFRVGRQEEPGGDRRSQDTQAGPSNNQKEQDGIRTIQEELGGAEAEPREANEKRKPGVVRRKAILDFFGQFWGYSRVA